MTSNGRKIQEQILALLGSANYRPLNKSELAKALGRKSGVRMGLSQVLRDLERAGEIARIRKNRYVLPPAADLIAGKLHIHQAGYGFLISEKPGESDIFIAAENTGTAMHGDRVVARISPDEPSGRIKGRREGRVIRILERAHDTIVGTLQRSRNFYYVVPDDPRIVHDVYVGQVSNSPQGESAVADLPLAAFKIAPQVGDKVVVRLEAWESRHVNPEGEIIEVLGPASAPGIDMLSIIRKYHLPTEFPRDVLDHAKGIPETVDARQFEGREDLRGEFIVTVDPDDARDFDDAIHVEKIGGGWRLGVHIADVAAYVEPDSPLDREARRRGNSVYLPDRVIPMLPERLSNGVCSLNPGVDRLTHSVFIHFDKHGNAKSARFARSLVRSARRLTYKQAYAILTAAPGDQLGERLHLAWELAALLRQRRFEHGALDLDFPEVKVWVDKDGHPVKLERVENDKSHQLIEEFMLAANESVARELKKRAVPTIYRIHENPDPEKLAEFREFVLGFNYTVGDVTHRAELQRLLAATRGKPEEQALKVGLLKSLKRARYSPQPLGHYGLAKANYLHFTSPIRRYADLVVHRALGRDTAGTRGRSARSAGAHRHPDMAEIASIAEHISVTERTAADAEVDAVQMKKLEFFQRQLDAHNPQIFRASIVDVRNYGLMVELPDALITGLIHVSSLTDDFYLFEPARRQLIGRRSRKRFSVGGELSVFVARVDLFKRQVDFAIVTASQALTRKRYSKERKS
ncbi:MAG: ribonuclease R [Verrucomicrobia bacterium]|nr:MAG: ribonuclease R [Verrucomicrobia bacterium 13_2_20CM_2_54_15]PYK15383.1 MAG: ribonuclease R [Verrucomicrobiota bacterium]PYL40982.1 MAG: ribonuclease R [Verrucomicrobiota bacterium]